MIVVSVHYPNAEGTKFDESYYLKRHMLLVRQRWSTMGLLEARVLRGLGAPDGSPAPARIIALLTWESDAAFKQAVATHGEEIFADIPNFTDVQPVIQISEPAG